MPRHRISANDNNGSKTIILSIYTVLFTP